MAQDWRRLLRLVDETFGDYLTGLVALRKRVVVNLKGKLANSESLDRASRRPRATKRRSPR